MKQRKHRRQANARRRYLAGPLARFIRDLRRVFDGASAGTMTEVQAQRIAGFTGAGDWQRRGVPIPDHCRIYRAERWYSATPQDPSRW